MVSTPLRVIRPQSIACKNMTRQRCTASSAGASLMPLPPEGPNSPKYSGFRTEFIESKFSARPYKPQTLYPTMSNTTRAFHQRQQRQRQRQQQQPQQLMIRPAVVTDVIIFIFFPVMITIMMTIQTLKTSTPVGNNRSRNRSARRSRP